jgi:hypothetical protein
LTSTSDTEWTTFSADYASLNWGSCDPTQIKEILVFTQPGQLGSGVYYVDNIELARALSTTSSLNKRVSGLLGHIKVIKPISQAAVRALFAVAATATPTLAVTATPTMTATAISISDYLGQKEVVAFPNPGRDKITIAWNRKNAEKAKIEIFNLAGERIALLEEHQPGRQSETWNVQGIAPGVYIYRTVLTIDGKETSLPVKKVAVIQ